MPIVLQNSTVTGNTAIGQDSNLLNFTKVMLKTNPATDSDADDYFAFQTSEGDAGDASADKSGRQADSFLVTFDRPVDPSEPGFDTQGRLLIGTDGGIWSGQSDDLLIGGRTTFDFDTLADFSIEQPVDRADDAPTEEISFAFGDLKVGYLGNSTSSADSGHAGGGGHGAGKAVFSDMSFSASVMNQDAPVSFDAYSPTFLGGIDVPASANPDGSVRTIPPATDAAGVTEYESGLVYSGESGGMGASPTGHYTQMVWANSDASASLGRQAMLKMFTADYVGDGESFADAGAADAAAAGGFGTWGLDRIDQRPPAPDDGGARLGDADTFDFPAYDASFRGGVSVAVGDVDGAGVGTSAATLGDGSVRVVFRSGTDEPAWSHGGDDLLIGGTTAFDGAPGNLQIAALTGFDFL